MLVVQRDSWKDSTLPWAAVAGIAQRDTGSSKAFRRMRRRLLRPAVAIKKTPDWPYRQSDMVSKSVSWILLAFLRHWSLSMVRLCSAPPQSEEPRMRPLQRYSCLCPPSCQLASVVPTTVELSGVTKPCWKLAMSIGANHQNLPNRLEHGDAMAAWVY